MSNFDRLAKRQGSRIELTLRRVKSTMVAERAADAMRLLNSVIAILPLSQPGQRFARRGSSLHYRAKTGEVLQSKSLNSDQNDQNH